MREELEVGKRQDGGEKELSTMAGEGGYRTSLDVLVEGNRC